MPAPFRMNFTQGEGTDPNLPSVESKQLPTLEGGRSHWQDVYGQCGIRGQGHVFRRSKTGLFYQLVEDFRFSLFWGSQTAILFQSHPCCLPHFQAPLRSVGCLAERCGDTWPSVTVLPGSCLQICAVVPSLGFREHTWCPPW